MISIATILFIEKKMAVSFIIMTNNPLVRDRYRGQYSVEYQDGVYMDLLVRVRDKVHAGHKLLTHPLSGSVKPNETPYKSVMISQKRGTMDLESLSIIEEAIVACRKFPVKYDGLPQRVLEDFQLVDLTLIDSAIPSASAF